VCTNTTGRPERVVPYSGLFLAPDIEPADDDGDE
jgi:hypothetical protein